MTHITWEAVVENLLDAVLVVQPQTQTITFANLAAARLLQTEVATLVGSPVLNWTDDLQDHVFWESWQLDVESVLESQTMVRCADGHPVPVMRKITPLTLSDGQRIVALSLRDIADAESNRLRLEELLAELRSALDSSSDGILITDLHGHIRAFNHSFVAHWDVPETLLTQLDEAEVWQHLVDRVCDAPGFVDTKLACERNPLMECDDLVILKDGRMLERHTRPQLARGRPIGRLYVFRDVTSRAASDAKLRLAAKVFESSLDAIVVTDAERHVVACNPAALRLTDQPMHALEGGLVDNWFAECARQGMFAGIQEALSQRGAWEGELRLTRRDGAELVLLVSWVVLRAESGQVQHTVLFAKDLSERMEAQRRIEQLAYTDPLTGLPNRLMLGERVGHAIACAQRSGKGFAVLFLDLDRFKSINDSLGHLFGDQVLQEVAARLGRCLRNSDTLCRLGGDEFVIHLHDAGHDAANGTAQRILDAINLPVQVGELQFSMSCSIGIALYPQDGQTLDELVRSADTAMYQVKERGKGHHRFYQADMNADLLERVQLDHAIRQGLTRQEFVLHYQPRVDVQTGAIVGCEALMRWQRPGHGLVMPGGFIDVAEETGCIVQMGRWLADTAVAQAVRWLHAGRACQVAINVSALEFAQPDFVQQVANVLQRSGLPAHLLELELTESILIRDVNEAQAKLKALQALGVHLALDDFGTGYSSLTYLKRFVVHRIKIDQSFVRSLPDNTTDQAIVDAIVRMGHALSMDVVAEGVEHAPQLEWLKTIGCDQFQGFLFSRAVPADDMARLLGLGTGTPDQSA
jgi:diguanylate cyclase (GGDEF)-like protein/PAS domain S-box-containing protein